jgi:hypothetical protein
MNLRRPKLSTRNTATSSSIRMVRSRPSISIMFLTSMERPRIAAARPASSENDRWPAHCGDHLFVRSSRAAITTGGSVRDRNNACQFVRLQSTFARSGLRTCESRLRAVRWPRPVDGSPGCIAPRRLYRVDRREVYLIGREPAMRMSTSLLALCCQSPPEPT